MNNNNNYIQRNIPNVKYQRSSSIPLKKILSNDLDNQNKINRELSRPRQRPVSKNLKELNDERLNQFNKIEEEVIFLEKENAYLNRNNNDYELYLKKIKTKNETLNLQIKGLRDKILQEQKLKNNLLNKLTKIKKDFELSQKEFHMHKILTDYRLNVVNNNIKHNKNISEDRKNSFGKKIESELSNKQTLVKNLKEVKNKIQKMRSSLYEINHKRNKSTEIIYREKFEMEKFLNNI